MKKSCLAAQRPLGFIIAYLAARSGCLISLTDVYREKYPAHGRPREGAPRRRRRGWKRSRRPRWEKCTRQSAEGTGGRARLIVSSRGSPVTGPTRRKPRRESARFPRTGVEPRRVASVSSRRRTLDGTEAFFIRRGGALPHLMRRFPGAAARVPLCYC